MLETRICILRLSILFLSTIIVTKVEAITIIGISIRVNNNEKSNESLHTILHVNGGSTLNI